MLPFLENAYYNHFDFSSLIKELITGLTKLMKWWIRNGTTIFDNNFVLHCFTTFLDSLHKRRYPYKTLYFIFLQDLRILFASTYLLILFTFSLQALIINLLFCRLCPTSLFAVQCTEGKQWIQWSNSVYHWMGCIECTYVFHIFYLNFPLEIK